MELTTLDNGFVEKDIIDSFESAIWTERYFGNGDFNLKIPAEPDIISKLPKNQIMMCKGSDRPMILETRDIKDGLMEATGISLTQWLNNRIIRTSADHAIREWQLSGYSPGDTLIQIVQQMCVGGPYLDGSIDIGIPSAQTALFSIPGLQSTGVDTDPEISVSVPFGPVYDALNQIATTYEVGMEITLDGVFADYFIISFRAYRGEDRTSTQHVNPTIRFSPELETFTNIRDLESVTDYRNFSYVFAPGVDPTLITGAGFASSIEDPEPGFGLRVFQGFADNIDNTDLTAPVLLARLNEEAKNEIKNHKIVQLVDGEIIQTGQIKYGTHYFLGDVVEVEGNTGVLQKARITEYIRSQDSAGERAYPTLSMID